MSYYRVLVIDMTIFGARRRSRDGSPNLQSYISAIRCHVKMQGSEILAVLHIR